MNTSILAIAVLMGSTVAATAGAQLAPSRLTGRSDAVQRPGKRRFLRPLERRAERVGVIEGEALVAAAHATDGRVSRQSMSVFGENWSGDAQLLWAPRRVDARLEVTVNVPEAGRYTMAAHLTSGPDYGKFQVSAHGKQIGQYDGFARRVVRSEKIALGTTNLQSGENTFLFVITGRDVRAQGYLVGIDALEFSPTRKPAPRSVQRSRRVHPKVTAIHLGPPEGSTRVAHVGDSTILEGEQLLATARAELGEPRRQPMVRFGRSWSGDAQLWWRAPRRGARLFLSVQVPKAGNYTIAGWFTRAPDYGRFQLARVDGEQVHPLDEIFDGYDVRVMRSEKFLLGSLSLEAGTNQLVLEVAGKNPRSTGFSIGIDALELTPETLSPPEFITAVEAATTLPRRLRAAQRRELNAIVRDLKYDKVELAKARWDFFARGMIYTNDQDLDAIIQWVLREAYLENNADLKAYAAQARSHREKQYPSRAGAGGDAPLANIDLQSYLQEHQQTLQTMSNVSKTLHDTGMAVIRKIGE